MNDTANEMQLLSFQIILHAGNARSSAMEAISLAKAGDALAAREKMDEVEQEFTEAHKLQTKLLQDEASGNKTELSVILIHAQDHLMTAMTVKDMANEFIDLYEKMQVLEGSKA